MKTSLKSMFAALAILFAYGTTQVSAADVGYFSDQKVVYHNNGGAPDNATYFRQMLKTIDNHIASLGTGHIEIRVVSHTDGVDLFQIAQADKDLAGRLDALRAGGVRFLVCANTLKNRKIDWRTLYRVKEEDIVPGGVAELVRLQGMGFTYIHL
jgi:intracellular sulfur oxidation DsrE/DsrF family protein